LTPYFEINLNPNPDYFLWFVPVAILFIFFFKFQPATDSICTFIRLSRTKFLSAYFIVTLISLIGTYNVYSEHSKINDLIERGEFKVVSGCIENYKLDDVKGNSASFDLAGVNFSYNNYTRTSFFYEREYTYEVMKNGSCLEISFIPSERKNGIIKIVQLTSQ